MSASIQNLGLPPRTAEIPPAEAADPRAFRHSEAYLAAAQKLSHTGSFGWKIPSGEIYWSEETFRIYEYAPTTRPTVELILQRVHPDDAEMVRRTIERIAQEQKDFDFEFRLLMPNGAVKHLRAVAHPEPDTGGGVEFVGAVMDVTKGKEAEEGIRLIINTVPGHIWTTDADGRIDFISQRLLDYFGANFEQAGRQEPGLYAHPDEVAAFQKLWRTKIAEKKPFEWEIRLRSSAGEYRWFLSRASPLFDRSGNVTSWYGNNVDIHERKLADEKLRESEAYLTEAQRLSGTGSFAWNPHTAEILYWSHECYLMLGFDEREGIPLFESHPSGGSARHGGSSGKGDSEQDGFRPRLSGHPPQWRGPEYPGHRSPGVQLFRRTREVRG